MIRTKNPIVVIAIGGNAIIKNGQLGTLEEQFKNLAPGCEQIVNLIEDGYKVVIVHGNGPHVGNELLKNETASHIIPPNSLDLCCAGTQGYIGYMIQQCLYNTMARRGMSSKVVSVVTQVVVNSNDPAFKNPTKPVGPFYTKKDAEKIMKENNVKMVEDSGRGYRRVVYSPKPEEVVEKEIIKNLVCSGNIVIAAGGGGTPVIKNGNCLEGIEAVIDKDFSSAVLAKEIEADYLIMLTGVEKVALNYGTSEQKDLSKITVEQAEVYLEQGNFPAGSMGPKVEAAIQFLKAGGQSVIITSMQKLQEATKGAAGTEILRAARDNGIEETA